MVAHQHGCGCTRLREGVQAAMLQLEAARAAQPVAARGRGPVHILPIARHARRGPVNHHELQLGGPGLGVPRGWDGGHAPLASARCRPAGGPLHGHLPPPLQPAAPSATWMPAGDVDRRRGCPNSSRVALLHLVLVGDSPAGFPCVRLLLHPCGILCPNRHIVTVDVSLVSLPENAKAFLSQPA